MIFKPYYRYQTGCAGYLFGCGTKSKCIAVDVHADDIDDYAAFAASKSMRITHVVDTHVHADHRSGGAALAKLAGASYCLSKHADVDMAFTPLDDGQRIECGNTLVDVMLVPGHTPEGLALVVRDLRRGDEPWFVCTGDTLFVGSVGRPDLPGDERGNAAKLHASITRLLTLRDDVEIFPAHFAGSSCGVGLSGKPSSTIGFEKHFNALLSASRERFVDEVGGNVPPKPADIDAILRANRGR